MFTICYNPMVSKLEATQKTEVKSNSSTWPQKSYLDFEILGFHFPKIGLSTMCKSTYIRHWGNIDR